MTDDAIVPVDNHDAWETPVLVEVGAINDAENGALVPPDGGLGSS